MIRRPLVAVVVAGSLALLCAPAALAAGPAHPAVVSAVPQDGTPQILDGAVYAAAQVGGVMVVGGSFTRTADPASTTARATPYVLAFDAETGAVRTNFLPALDGAVNTLLPGPTPGTVYAGGAFTTARGAPAKSLVLLNLSDGSRVGTFRMPPTDGVVQTVERVGSRLFVGGSFSKVDATPHGGLVTLDATTGAVDPYLASSVTGHHNWTPSSPPNAAKGAVGVTRLDITPDGTKLVAIGNFTSVDSAMHDQIAMWDLLPAGAALRDWHTSRLEPACLAATYDSYVRDVEFSPDGSYFSLVNTGGARDGALCDSASRWETAATGPDVQPTWVAYTGQDSLLSTAVTGEAVYVGGHQRWLNNGLARDRPGPGAVPRPGVAALDPANGLPLTWNPGRNPRGVGAGLLHATPTGLWMGSDTDWVGNRTYRRGKLAFFPLRGGAPAAAKTLPALPGRTFSGTVPPAGPTGVLHRVNAGGPLLQSTDAGPDWSADTALASPLRNAGSTAVSYPTPVPSVDATVPAGAPPAVFADERTDPGTKGDGKELRWRFPVPAGTSVDVRVYLANRCTCAEAPGSRVFDIAVDGVTAFDDLDVYATAGDQTGTMRQTTVTSDGTVDIAFTHEAGNPFVSALELVRTGAAAPPSPQGALVGRSFNGTTAGAATPVDSPLDVSAVRGATVVGSSLFYGRTDGRLYRRAISGPALGAEVLVDPYNDPFWSDVETGSGNRYRGTAPSFFNEITNLTSMFYDGKGRLYYTLYRQSTLFYRDFSPDSGVLGSLRQSAGTLPDITGAFLTGGTLYYATRADGNLSSVAFDGGPTGSAAVVSGPGTDGIDWRSRVLYLGAPPLTSPIAYRGSSSVKGTTATSLAVPVPAGTRTGDAMLLKVSTSGVASNPQVPAGWTEVGRQSAGTALSVLWQHVATAQDTPGSTVRVTLATAIKSNIQLLSYGGTSASPVTAVTSRGDGAPVTDHAAPAVPVRTAGSWVVRFWTDKSSATTAWQLAGGELRAAAYGSGTGYLTAVAADAGAPSPVGTAPEAFASTDSASRAASFSVVLAPAI
ncbi:MAG TPA: malectin domain-containing carbohydrate-binding protein [Mycobacteriales bacterium]|nr:malectin domain-containing carbohydrate-binding protein [Mycobacteriales bacterium]